MPKFIIWYDAGYGNEYEVVEAADRGQARKTAYEAWRAAAEENADCDAEPYTKERAVELGIEGEDEEAEW